MPKVSVIIPAYNCAQYLKDALDSALNQTFQDFEVIVIDDGSTDGTKEVVQPYLNDYPDKIRYIYQENSGVSCARNNGIRAARGEMIALLDADDQWLPQRLEYTVDAMESDKAVGLVHANITRITQDSVPFNTPQRDKKYLSGSIFENVFLRRADISCPTVLFRKECCQRLGLFDENLGKLGCEDRELWIRITQQYKAAYVDKVLALYRMSKGSMSQNQEKMMKARLYVIDKFCPAEGGNQRLRKKALAKIYRDMGDELLICKSFKDSKKYYLQSVTQDPLSVWSWVNLMKAIFRIEVRHV